MNGWRRTEYEISFSMKLKSLRSQIVLYLFIFMVTQNYALLIIANTDRISFSIQNQILPVNLQCFNICYLYRRTWICQTQWDQENWSVICKIRRIHMTNTWYASDWDQAYRPSYAKICHTVGRHIQVHLYTCFLGGFFSVLLECYLFPLQDRLLKPLGGYMGYSNEWRDLAQTISRVSQVVKFTALLCLTHWHLEFH